MPSRLDIAKAPATGRSAARPALLAPAALALKSMPAMMIITIPPGGAEFTRAP